MSLQEHALYLDADMKENEYHIGSSPVSYFLNPRTIFCTKEAGSSASVPGARLLGQERAGSCVIDRDGGFGCGYMTS